MELRTASPAELKTVYETFLRSSFPPAELKPLRAMMDMYNDGCYDPLVLVDGEEIMGACFLWLGVPGWALLDYLCVSPTRRSGGYGAKILQLMRQAYAGWTIIGEAEDPAFSPDPAMAERRLGFYTRNNTLIAAYDSEAFGVRYKTLYWSDNPVDEAELALQHRFIYESSFGEEKYAKYVRIPCPAGAKPMPQIPWDQ
ncbi:GNAT family N-acetyltransferase [Oscillibacter ruminantium]|jgi:GNAT superfamily N-acetyltransferase|uniref:GNAT family N-acetyltransferase n=1 Tax=Oscillibacter ruminantium TaxID=1263547 RepID=UPI0002E60564|nr:GNAT family N-acetyltransferase [Oscillibacter ruminantium]